MKSFLFGFAALALFLLGANTASAQYPTYGGSYYRHTPGHYHYEPGHFDRHGNHFHYHPGHYEYHRGPDIIRRDYGSPYFAEPRYYPSQRSYYPQYGYGFPRW